MSTDQPTSRRNFLVKSAVLIPAATSLAACAPKSDVPSSKVAKPAPEADVALADYQPVFFNAAEWVFIKAAVERLIPADAEGPGALDLNVPVFIDRQMDSGFGHASNWYRQGPFKPDAEALWGYQGPLAPRDLYRAAIAAIDAHCRSTFADKPFAELAKEQQDQLLHDMQDAKLELASIDVGHFFTFLLQNTKEGYLADPMYGGNKDSAAWKMIGFPGARADYLDWVGRNERYPFGPVSINGK
jgi:gluconate 2-dehydrogenase gamma chain